MCIILTCEPKHRPSMDLVSDCFAANPDGAGIMWCENGLVQTAKGFMDEWSLLDAIQEVPEESPLVIHMRIATSGGINAGTCHPFPVCDDLNALHAEMTECHAAIAHNGIITGMPTSTERGISDTVSFVVCVVNGLLAKTHNKVNKKVRRAIMDAAPGNRFAIMTGNGKVFRIGEGWETVTTGIEASNSTWRIASLYNYKLYNYKWLGSSYEPDLYGAPMYGPEYQETFDMLCKGCCCKATCMHYGPSCDDVYDMLADEPGDYVPSYGGYEWAGYDNSTIQRYGWPADRLYGSEDYYMESDYSACV